MHGKRANFERGVVIPLIAILLPIIAAGIIGLSLASRSRPNPAPPQRTPNSNSGRLGFGQIDVRVPIAAVDVTFSFKESGTPQLTVTEVKQVSAFVPTYPPLNAGYTLEVVDAREAVTASTRFAIPNKSEDIAVLNGESSQGRIITFPEVNFILTLPTTTRSRSIRIKDPDGSVIETKQLAQAKKNLLATTVDTVYSSITSSLSTLVSAQTNAPEFVDIAFVSANYNGNMGQFRSDVEKSKSHLLTHEPIKSRASQFKFYTVDNTQDLGCKRMPPGSRILVCDHAKAVEAVRQASVPYDIIIVIVNDNEYGGAAYISNHIAFTYNGILLKEVFVHELGHAFGELLDEYTYGTTEPHDNKVHANCFAGSPPASEWNGIVQSGDYANGCTHNNWRRSSEHSVMQALVYDYFNEVSKRLLNERIDYYAGRQQPEQNPTAPPSGTAPPTTRPTASPTAPPSPSPTPKPSSGSNQGYSLSLRNVGCLQGQARVNFAITQPSTEGSMLVLYRGSQEIRKFEYIQPPSSSATIINLPPRTELHAELHKSPLHPFAPGQLGKVIDVWITTASC